MEPKKQRSTPLHPQRLSFCPTSALAPVKMNNQSRDEEAREVHGRTAKSESKKKFFGVTLLLLFLLTGKQEEASGGFSFKEILRACSLPPWPSFK
mmetsp:Transcript_38376/g.75348  ORF Transcript_38376/g.75348 Transcript_38376/m.75348 type:complete len:95 (+) Transcript_38376:1248-1532(+)